MNFIKYVNILQLHDEALFIYLFYDIKVNDAFRNNIIIILLKKLASNLNWNVICYPNL